MALAEGTTNNAMQRARLAQAIILPKILYMARHCWSPRHIRRRLQRLIRNLVWKHRTTDHIKSKGWLPEHAAANPSHAGGVGLPLITAGLQAMAGAHSRDPTI
ncbi:TPA: hypothetical protein N0F65_010932 [Lagenidium giganteum]|uniref:Uncharacterized protein n=1 Tax=Lagenidium giganteum TaxID=4803 RepID=A0AAV2YXF2_9STRA|nr:TPA: hypothetical protein N0F65_010932 [Lagenidium giganteum]